MNWIIIFFGFCLLIMLHEAGHFFAAKATGMRVERFFLFFGPTIWSFKRGETEYGVKSIPLGGYVKISGMNPEEELPPEEKHRAYYRQKVWKRIVVVAAGPAVNVALAFVILFFVYLFNANQYTQSVERIEPHTPAAGVLKPGDKILAVDGSSYLRRDANERVERFRGEIGAHKCAGKQKNGCLAATPVLLTVEREGKRKVLSVRPEYETSAGQVLIGFNFGAEPTEISASEATDRATGAIGLVVSGTFHVFSHLFESEQRKQLHTVVGISDVANQTLDRSGAEALLLLALVSLSLGLVNLLPILPLDGGHIFWAIVEKLRGAPVSLRVMERASIVGFVLIAMIFFIGLNNDVGRLTGEGFNVR
jgi:regulator of sigma E protease